MLSDRMRVARGGPWRGWYHVIGNTRGVWLPGDPRGWRSYGHRAHCEGDYRDPPPPGEHADRLGRARAAMKRPPVLLSPAARTAACAALADKLLALDTALLVLCVTDRHVHALARFCNYDADGKPRPDAVIPGLHARNALRDGRDPGPRHLFGRAKGHASRELGDAGLKPPGSLWGRRCHVKPIVDREHQLNVHRYIALHHRDENAAVWHFRGGLYPPPGHPGRKPR